MHEKDSKETVPHTPGHVPLSRRILYVFGAFLFVAYGTYGVVQDDLDIGRRGSLHLHGIAAWLVLGCLLCFAALLLSRVIRHYDKADNGTKYKTFSRKVLRMALVLFVLGLLWAMLEAVGRWVWNSRL